MSPKEAPMKFFYRIYKRKKHERHMNLIKNIAVNQPIVKYTSLTDTYHNKKIKNKSHTKMELQNVEPRHELKIIISKKPNKSYDKNTKNGDKVVLSQIPNKVAVKDFKQLRSNDEKTTFSTSASSTSTSTSTSSSSSSSPTSSNDTKALLNKITITKQLKIHKNSSDTKNKPDKSKNKLKKYLIEENVDQQKIVIKKLKRENSIPSSYCYINKPLSKSNSLEVPKVKIEMPSLKTKISVPKQPNESYCITPKSNSTSPSPSKKVRFNFPINDNVMDTTTTSTPATINNDVQLMQNEYAQKIGLKPVEKKVDSILLHRKRKKSKHSKNSIDIKRQKHHADVSSKDDKSLKMKITKNIKSNDSINDLKTNDGSKEYVINKNASVVEKQLPIDSVVVVAVVDNVAKPSEKEQQKFLLSHKVNSNALQPMVFIPKLNLKATSELLNPMVKEMPQLKNTEIVVKTIAECNRDVKQSCDVVMSSGSSSGSADAVFVKPSRAKMGSPNNNNKKTHPKPFVPHQTYFTPRFGNSPTRPHSIPSTLKLSPISSYSHSMDHQKKPGVNLEGFNNSQNRFLNNDLFSPGYDTMPNVRNNHRNTLKMPPLVPASCIITDSSHISSNLQHFNNNNNIKVNELYKNVNRPSNPIPTLSYTTTTTSTPNLPQNTATFKKPQAVDILRVPSTQHNNRIKYSPMAAMDKRAIKYENYKINRPQLSTIPLDKIKQSHEISTISSKINYYDNMPKLVSYQTSSNVIKEKAIQSSIHLRGDSSDILDYSNKYDPYMMKKDFHNDEITKMIEDQSGLNKDIISYERELSKDIAKLDQRLSVEKNIEQHSKTHEKNLSVRNIPNPSALQFRNTNNFKQNDGTKDNLINKIDMDVKVSNANVKEKANVLFTDIEEILKTTTIPSNSTDARESGITPEQRLENALKMRSVAKKTLEKLVEHLHVNSKKVLTVAPIIPASREENDKNNNEDKINNNDKDNNNNSNNNNCKLNDIICIDV